MASNRQTDQRTATPAANRGSLTVTSTEAGPSTPFNLSSGTLRLRAVQPETTEQQPRVQWAEDVIDNEGMGRKSSKVCCIYHKPREAGESSDESSSDSSSSSDDADSGPDTSRAQPVKRRTQRHHQHHHAHDHDHDHGHADAPHPSGGNVAGKGKAQARRASPNAYERVPKRKEPKK